MKRRTYHVRRFRRLREEGMDYLQKIRNARTPDCAALYIRAQATHVAGSLPLSSDRDRILIVSEAENLARMIERCTPDDGNIWRQWLKQAGY